MWLDLFFFKIIFYKFSFVWFWTAYRSKNNKNSSSSEIKFYNKFEIIFGNKLCSIVAKYLQQLNSFKMWPNFNFLNSLLSALIHAIQSTKRIRWYQQIHRTMAFEIISIPPQKSWNWNSNFLSSRIMKPSSSSLSLHFSRIKKHFKIFIHLITFYAENRERAG